MSGISYERGCGMGLPRQVRFLLLLVCVACVSPRSLSQEPALTKEQMRQFLLTARISRGKSTDKGVTAPSRLTLTDGAATHDALFQAIDQRKDIQDFAMGPELNFVDSYKYNIAAYQLAELLGLEDMLPVTVERKWEGKTGALSWWLPVMMDEAERTKRKLHPPDAEAWNRQMYRIRVFDQLIRDNDPNLTNVLIGHDWQLWRIDFTRAFRLQPQLQSVRELERCDRQLLEKLRALDANELAERTKGYLGKPQIKSLLARRDLIVRHFDQMIAAKGAGAVLY